MEPIGIFLGNTEAACDFKASPEKRNCIIPLLIAVSKGKIISIDEESCNCPGGATGCYFGVGFTRRNPNIHKMLSQGYGDEATVQMPKQMIEGERFFCSEDLALKWRNNMPFSEKGYPCVVLTPMSRWNEVGEPDVMFVFAQPDQLSALVTMLGSHSGEALNTLAPFGAACHSILYAAEQMEKAEPKAILGLFDISQRRESRSGFLSLTMPFPLWDNLNKDLDKSLLLMPGKKLSIGYRFQLKKI